MIATLLQLALLFGGLSLLAFGGGTAVLPDMQRVTVTTYHWLTAAQFLDFFAISRASPGPGSLIVVLIGQKSAGLPGALVAFLAMFGPSSALLYVAALVWHRAAHTAWRALLERGAGAGGYRPDAGQRPGADRAAPSMAGPPMRSPPPPRSPSPSPSCTRWPCWPVAPCWCCWRAASRLRDGLDTEGGLTIRPDQRAPYGFHRRLCRLPGCGPAYS